MLSLKLIVLFLASKFFLTKTQTVCKSCITVLEMEGLDTDVVGDYRWSIF